MFLYCIGHSLNPPGRVVLDAVSSLTTAIIKSLKLGCLRGCKLMFVFVVTHLIFCLIIVVVLFVVGLENYSIVPTLIVCIFVIVILFFVMTLKKVFVLIFQFICIVLLSLLN